MLKKMLDLYEKISDKFSKAKKITTKVLEKTSQLKTLSEDLIDTSSPYGPHLSTMQIDYFDNGIYVSVKNKDTGNSTSKFFATKKG